MNSAQQQQQQQQYRPSDDPHNVVPPFAAVQTVADGQSGARKGSGAIIAIVLAVLVILGLGGFFVTRYLNNPFRTLEQFPVAKYLESFRALNGSRFKGELHVEADLGFKEGIGRLMLFTAEADPRPIAVLIPADIARDIYFTKGQTYMAELEVKEGGLIRANRVEKL